MTETTPAVPTTHAVPELIDPQTGSDRVARGALLIDVRSQPTRERVGGLPDAVVVDRDRLPDLFGSESDDRLDGVDDLDRPIVVVCGSVNGSLPVAEWLLEHGYTNTVHVEGGFPSWIEAGLLTSPGTEANTED